MSEPRQDDFKQLTESQMLRVNRACNEYESLCQSGGTHRVEEILDGLPAEDQPAALVELLPLEIEYRRRAGETLSIDDFATRFPAADPNWLADLLNATRGRSSRPVAEPPAVPDKLGDYQIVSRLGGGGMGTVYKAVHTRMGRAVALKVLRAEMQHDPAWLQRFDREVRVAARLTHPNIVAALDAREQDGLHFLITELVEGADLESTVRDGGPFAVSRAADCILQAARGLDYAHRQGVVHRDIKPANLLLDGSGVVKVLDMGLARLESPDDVSASSLTKAGMVMGTAAYMAPEQARDTRRADARSDIYSLGCTLHFLLTGRPLFIAETVVDTILSHVQGAVPSLAGIGNPSLVVLDGVFRRMVAKDPAARFQSAAELVTALESLVPELPKEPLAAFLPREVERRSRSMDFRDAPTIALVNTMAPPVTRSERPQRNLLVWLVPGLLLFAILAGAVAYSFLPPVKKKEQGSPPLRQASVLAFNGTSSYVAVPDLVPTAGETYTLEAFVTPNGFRTSNVISWLGPDWMALFIDEKGQWGLARRFGGDSYLVHYQQPATLGKAVHLAGVFRGADLRLFINGRPVETTRSTFALSETNGGLFLGGVPSDRLPAGQNDRFFNGLIRSVRISRGARYERPFEPPDKFLKDSQAIAIIALDEGRGAEIRGTGERNWAGRIADAQWQAESK